MAQVYDALSYYQDHMEEINHHMIRNRVPSELVGKRIGAEELKAHIELERERTSQNGSSPQA